MPEIFNMGEFLEKYKGSPRLAEESTRTNIDHTYIETSLNRDGVCEDIHTLRIRTLCKDGITDYYQPLRITPSSGFHSTYPWEDRCQTVEHISTSLVTWNKCFENLGYGVCQGAAPAPVTWHSRRHLHPPERANTLLKRIFPVQEATVLFNHQSRFRSFHHTSLCMFTQV